MLERDHPRNDRPFVQRQSESMAELQTECRHLVGEAEIRRPRPDAAHLVGRDAGFDEGDGLVEPLARFFVGVVLRGRGTSHVEGAIVAGAVAHERLENIEERLIAWAQHAVREIVRVRIATLAGNRVDRLDVIGPVPVQEFVNLGDDVVLANARFELLVDQVVGAVHHGGGAVEQRDLIDVLELARLEHHLLAVFDLQPRFLQFEHHRRLDDVDADRHFVGAGLLDQRGDLLGVPLHQPEGGIYGAA